MGSKTLDTQADARRSLERNRFAKTTPGTRSAYSARTRRMLPPPRACDPIRRVWRTSMGNQCQGAPRNHRARGVSSTVNRNLRGKRGAVESNDTADEAGAMFWYREEGVDPRRDGQDLGAAVRRCVSKTGRKLRRTTWASTCQSLGRGGAGEISLIPPVEVGVQAC